MSIWLFIISIAFCFLLPIILIGVMYIIMLPFSFISMVKGDFWDQKHNRKKLLTVGIASTLLILILTFAINTLFFSYKETQYGANTICYTNKYNNNYHEQSCPYLLNRRIKTTLNTAISKGYEECPSCTVDSSIHNTCYTTDYGEKFHSGSCQYLWNSANKTTVYKAIRSGKQECTKCYVYVNLNTTCYINPYGDYFHTVMCNYDSTETGIKIHKTNVKSAIDKSYKDCEYCDIGALDTSYKTVNFYGKSLLISLGIATAANVVFFVAYHQISRRNEHS